MRRRSGMHSRIEVDEILISVIFSFSLYGGNDEKLVVFLNIDQSVHSVLLLFGQHKTPNQRDKMTRSEKRTQKRQSKVNRRETVIDQEQQKAARERFEEHERLEAGIRAQFSFSR